MLAPGQVQRGSGEDSEGSVGEGLEALEQSQVRLNRISVLETVWEALVQSQVRFNGVPEKVWQALVQSQVRFNRATKKVPEKVWEVLV